MFIRAVSLNVLFPVAHGLSRLFHLNSDAVHRFFIDLNNRIAMREIKSKPEKILLLMPHCLQFSECEYRVTGREIKCKMCGQCEIKDLMEIAAEYNVELSIATGGTMARNIIKRLHPDIIIATACERDLMSGLRDTTSLPVIGILNERPNGPCIDTRVDIKKITKLIDSLKRMKHEKKY
jgi:hypothetical protein